MPPIVPMLATKSSPSPITGTLTGTAIRPQQSMECIEAAVREHIASWSPSAMNIANSLQANEVNLCSSLCIHLNQVKGDAPFHFHHQPPQGRRNLDIGLVPQSVEGITVDNHAYHRGEFFYAIEAKVMPLTGARKREYVVSEYTALADPTKKRMGAIERFKQGDHAPKLVRSSIVAFVQKIPQTPWMAVINGWIDDLIPTIPAVHDEPWSTADHLAEVSTSAGLDEYRSTHTRPALAPIRMCHFLLYLAGKN